MAKIANLGGFAVLCLIVAGGMVAYGLGSEMVAKRQFEQQCRSGNWPGRYDRQQSEPLPARTVDFIKECVEKGYLTKLTLDQHAI